PARVPAPPRTRSAASRSRSRSPSRRGYLGLGLGLGLGLRLRLWLRLGRGRLDLRLGLRLRLSARPLEPTDLVLERDDDRMIGRRLIRLQEEPPRGVGIVELPPRELARGEGHERRFTRIAQHRE